MNIQRNLIETYLPLINEKLKDDFYERVKLFHEIITSEVENIDFFNSPTKHLINKGIISLDHIVDDNGNRIDIYNDNELSTNLRELRKLYKSTGKITLPDDPLLEELREKHPEILLKGKGLRQGYPERLLERNVGDKTLKKGIDQNNQDNQLDTSSIR